MGAPGEAYRPIKVAVYDFQKIMDSQRSVA